MVSVKSRNVVLAGFGADLNDAWLEKPLQASGVSDLHGCQALVGSEGQWVIGILVTGTVGGGGLRRGLRISPRSLEA